MNSIGLPKDETKVITEKLNALLANYSVLYMNTRGFHWNIKGKEFFELHLKFEEIYNALVIQIDEIAERILTLDGVPIHSFSDNLKNASLDEKTNITNGIDALQIILESYTTIISQERDIMKLATEIDDEGTAAQMSDYIKIQEKEVWMFKAYLTK